VQEALSLLSLRPSQSACWRSGCALLTLPYSLPHHHAGCTCYCGFACEGFPAASLLLAEGSATSLARGGGTFCALSWEEEVSGTVLC